MVRLLSKRLIHKVIRSRIAAARGTLPCDILFTGGRILNVFTGEFLISNLAVHNGVIVGIGENLILPSKRTINITGKTIVPGFIDAHVHIESSLMTPLSFDFSVSQCGTTTAICDPHEIANVQGKKGLRDFLFHATQAQTDLRIMLSSCVPATHLETNGGGTLTASHLSKFMNHPKTLGLAEMMNVPGVLNAEQSALDKLTLFLDSNIDGHAPLVRGNDLSAYIASGITSCHESSEYDEANEKLSKGMSVWIREGSVAKDLNALFTLLNPFTVSHLGFCTDDRNPLDIATEGHIDHLIRSSIKLGIPPQVAYVAASYSVARHYHLHRGLDRTGALAPGFRADLVILNDVNACQISEVYIRGINRIELQFKTDSASRYPNTVFAKTPETKDLAGPVGLVNVIRVFEGKIITGHEVLNHDAEGVMKLSVLERHRGKSKPANAYVLGFGKLNGAIASSVGHDSHNLIVVGSDESSMRTALSSIIKSSGGFAVAHGNEVLSHLPLPYAGLMTSEEPQKIVASLIALRKASHEIGCVLHEPFLQLAFLSLPVIPKIKLTDRGLVDVEKFKIIPVRVN